MTTSTVPTPPSLPARAWSALRERRMPYRLSVLLDGLALRLGMRRKTVRVGGFRLRVRRRTHDEPIAHNVLVGGEYNPPGYDFQKGWTVIDVGANIGIFSLLASRAVAPGGAVYAFEPETENFSLLRENLLRNAAGNVCAHQLAVAASPGHVALHIGNETGMHSLQSREGVDTGQVQHVEAVTLAKVLDEVGRCDYLKMDCEGGELEILPSLPAESWARIHRIGMEWHSPTMREKEGVHRNLVTLLQGHGFRIDHERPDEGFRCGHLFARRD
jgi:FkbM family methyltransferase